MKSTFSNRLALLRREKKLGQRAAAESLGISQALLSHYENGAREPGLAFVIRACDFYCVTADYLLGRSLSREGAVILADEIPSAADDRDNTMRGGMLATLHKKLVINTSGLLFDLLARTGHNGLIKASARSLSLSLYKLFRLLYAANGRLPQNVFSVEPEVFSPMADAEIKLAEAEILKILQSGKVNLPDMGLAALAEEYPRFHPSLLSLLQNAGQRGKINSGR